MLKRLKSFARSIKREVQVYRLVVQDRRTPRLARWLLGLAVGYLLLPFDLIPDFLPGLGHLDDLVLVPALVLLALKLVPPQVLADCRAQVAASSRSAPPGASPREAGAEASRQGRP
jgi:uncharacterized membrane protein YkvA (DUF1232 family)